MNPQGVRVASFKAPSAHEAEHDFLWRVHEQSPARGADGPGSTGATTRTFCTPVVHGLVTKPVWERRDRDINDFERCGRGGHNHPQVLAHQPYEQKRLETRLTAPTKHWKFRESDVRERWWWTVYTHATEDALSNTSTPWAPWYVVLWTGKWYL